MSVLAVDGQRAGDAAPRITMRGLIKRACMQGLARSSVHTRARRRAKLRMPTARSGGHADCPPVMLTAPVRKRADGCHRPHHRTGIPRDNPSPPRLPSSVGKPVLSTAKLKRSRGPRRVSATCVRAECPQRRSATARSRSCVTRLTSSTRRSPISRSRCCGSGARLPERTNERRHWPPLRPARGWSLNGHGALIAANCSTASSASQPYTSDGPPPIITATPIVSITSARLAPACSASCTW